MWIESYKSKGQRYYRLMVKGEKPVHLGTPETIFRKVRPKLYAERNNQAIQPTERDGGDVDAKPTET